ncbi:MAG: hypothetical protein HDT14_04290 [Oscillibacter sp.]|nr:hypothetical protein [Oscillibacter sp.]
MQTSVMIDGIILVVFLLFAWLGWRKGLFRTLAELASVVAALLLATQIAGAAAPAVVDNALRPAAHAAIEQRVDEMMAENVSATTPVEELLRVVEGIPNSFVRDHARDLVEGLGLSTVRQASYSARETLVNLGYRVVDAALDGVVLQAVHAAVCAIAFLVSLIALRLAVRLLDNVFKLPVPFVREFNQLGGLLLGALKGAVLICLGVYLLARMGLILTPEVLEESWLAGAIAARLGIETHIF